MIRHSLLSAGGFTRRDPLPGAGGLILSEPRYGLLGLGLGLGLGIICTLEEGRILFWRKSLNNNLRKYLEKNIRWLVRSILERESRLAWSLIWPWGVSRQFLILLGRSATRKILICQFLVVPQVISNSHFLLELSTKFKCCRFFNNFAKKSLKCLMITLLTSFAYCTRLRLLV